MSRCEPQSLSPDDVARIAQANPGTVFQKQAVVWVTPEDTRSKVEKLYKSKPKPRPQSQTKVLGTFVRISGPFGNPQYNGGYNIHFTHNGTETVEPHEGDTTICGDFQVAQTAGRRSRVKKQTRRTQRKRRNTVRR